MGLKKPQSLSLEILDRNSLNSEEKVTYDNTVMQFGPGKFLESRVRRS